MRPSAMLFNFKVKEEMSVISLINMKEVLAKLFVINIGDCPASRHEKKSLLIDVDPQFNCSKV